MANDTIIAVRGWAGSDPMMYQHRDSETGKDTHISSAMVSVGVTARNYNRHTNKFEDGQTTWYSVRCFGALAHNVGISVHKGAPLLIRGRFMAKHYTDKDGIERTSQQIIADSVAIDLNNMVATYVKPSSYMRESTSDIHKESEVKCSASWADPLCTDAVDNDIAEGLASETVENDSSQEDTNFEKDLEKRADELASIGM